MYDYIVGYGLYEATFAQQAHQHGKSVLVMDAVIASALEMSRKELK